MISGSFVAASNMPWRGALPAPQPGARLGLVTLRCQVPSALGGGLCPERADCTPGTVQDVASLRRDGAGATRLSKGLALGTPRSTFSTPVEFEATRVQHHKAAPAA